MLFQQRGDRRCLTYRYLPSDMSGTRDQLLELSCPHPIGVWKESGYVALPQLIKCNYLERTVVMHNSVNKGMQVDERKMHVR